MKPTTKHHPILHFEPLSDSPIPILWDLLLACYAIRLTLLYALLTLLSHLILSPLPSSPITTLVSAALWTRYLTHRFQVPPAIGFRAAVGLLAGMIIFLMEELLSGLEYEMGYGGLKGLGGWVMAGVISMPVIMGLGEEGKERWGRWEGKGLEFGKSY